MIPDHDCPGRQTPAPGAVAARPALAATAALPRPRGRAPHRADRAYMAAIIFMARTSTPWALLPVAEFGCGSPTTCWRRLAEWAHAGVFERLQEVLLDELGEVGWLDWSRVSVDSFSLRAVRGGPGGRKPGRPGQARVQAAPGR